MRDVKIARYQPTYVVNRRRRLAPRTVASILFRQARPLTIAFIVLFVAALVYILGLPDRYVAQIQFLINKERADPANLEGTGTAAGRWLASPVTAGEINSELQLLGSRDILRKVVVSCGLDARDSGVEWSPSRLLPEWISSGGNHEPQEIRIERAVGSLQRSLHARRIADSAVIEVQYTSADPESAASAMERFADYYIEKHAEVRRRKGTLEFFQQRTEEFRQALHEARARLERFNRKHGLTSAEDEKMRAVRNAAEFNAESERLAIEASATGKRIESLERQLVATESRVTTEVRTSARPLEELQGKLFDLEERRTQLLEKFQAEYPLVKEVDAQIAKTRESIRNYKASPLREEVTNANPTHAWIESELARARAIHVELTAKRARLAETLSRDRAAVRRLESLDSRQKDLLRDVALTEQNYLKSLQQQEESRISDELERNNMLQIAIAEQVKRPVLRSGPNRFHLTLLAILFSMAGACVFAFVLDRLDPTFRTPEEVIDCLEIPVVVSVVRN